MNLQNIKENYEMWLIKIFFWTALMTHVIFFFTEEYHNIADPIIKILIVTSLLFLIGTKLKIKFSKYFIVTFNLIWWYFISSILRSVNELDINSMVFIPNGQVTPKIWYSEDLFIYGIQFVLVVIFVYIFWKDYSRK
jgi:hypothetical protein